MKQYINMIEDALYGYIPKGDFREQKLIDAVEYSLRLPGKRVRPALTLAFCELCGGSAELVLPYACALEMIHTFTLIHDDLPCMDDDDFRRGKPSNHKVFGEDMAVLAGDALQSMAYSAMSDPESVRGIGCDNAVKAIRTLADKSGLLGTAGGQAIDLMSEGGSVDIGTLREMDEKKTAALIEAACMIGCICAGGSEQEIAAAECYGRAVGTAFQIVDDILDVTSTTAELGKPVGSDKINEKSTYVSLLGIDRCYQLVYELTVQAVESLSAFKGDTADLVNYAKELAGRKR